MKRYVTVAVTKSCPTLCNLMDYSPPGSCVHGILQARILEWVVGTHSLLQGIFSTQGSNLGLLHCGRFLPSEPPAKPYICIYFYNSVKIIKFPIAKIPEKIVINIRNFKYSKKIYNSLRAIGPSEAFL